MGGHARGSVAVGFGDYLNRSHVPDDWDLNRGDLLLPVKQII